MTLFWAKLVWGLGLIGWFAIRHRHARRSRRTPKVTRDHRHVPGPRDLRAYGSAQIGGISFSTSTCLGGRRHLRIIALAVLSHAQGARSKLVGHARDS